VLKAAQALIAEDGQVLHRPVQLISWCLILGLVLLVPVCCKRQGFLKKLPAAELLRLLPLGAYWEAQRVRLISVLASVELRSFLTLGRIAYVVLLLVRRVMPYLDVQQAAKSLAISS
jgi:hypothetical protein